MPRCFQGNTPRCLQGNICQDVSKVIRQDVYKVICHDVYKVICQDVYKVICQDVSKHEIQHGGGQRRRLHEIKNDGGPRRRLHEIGPRRARRQSCLYEHYEGRTEPQARVPAFFSWPLNYVELTVWGPWWSLLLSRLKCEDAFLLKRGSLVTGFI